MPVSWVVVALVDGVPSLVAVGALCSPRLLRRRLCREVVIEMCRTFAFPFVVWVRFPFSFIGHIVELVVEVALVGSAVEVVIDVVVVDVLLLGRHCPCSLLLGRRWPCSLLLGRR